MSTPDANPKYRDALAQLAEALVINHPIAFKQGARAGKTALQTACKVLSGKTGAPRFEVGIGDRVACPQWEITVGIVRGLLVCPSGLMVDVEAPDGERLAIPQGLVSLTGAGIRPDRPRSLRKGRSDCRQTDYENRTPGA